MKDLFESIYTRYQATGLTTLLSAFYNTEAPEDAVFPYGIFSLVSDTPDWTFSENFENCLIQFDLFSKTVNAVEVCSLYEFLKDAFDFQDLFINNHITVSMVRENSNLIRAEDVWQFSITYRVMLQKD